MSEQPVNVWMARHPREGNTVYCVGIYKDGRYTCPNSDAVRRLSGCGAWFGPFGYGNIYSNESAARSAARRYYGYSRKENAYAAMNRNLEIA